MQLRIELWEAEVVRARFGESSHLLLSMLWVLIDEMMNS